MTFRISYNGELPLVNRIHCLSSILSGFFLQNFDHGTLGVRSQVGCILSLDQDIEYRNKFVELVLIGPGANKMYYKCF